MFATTPNATLMHSLPLFSCPASPLTLRDLTKGQHACTASTRSASPGSSSSSSEEASVESSSLQDQLINSTGESALACRRGRSVLMLNELVMDLDILPVRGSPSADSSSSAELISGQSSICTPSTQQMMSFSPPKSKSGLLATRTMDASQRTPACQRGLCTAVAGGDASQ